MKARHFDFTAWIEVHDENQLLQAARSHPDAADMVTEDFHDDEGNVDIGACLVMLLDPGSLPGCEIVESGATEAETYDVDFGEEKN